MAKRNTPRGKFIDSDSRREDEAARLIKLAAKAEREWGDEGRSTAHMYRGMAQDLSSHHHYGSLSLFGDD